MNFNNDDQLKSFLKSESKRLGITINSTYSTFFAIILLKRISNISAGELVVKGSFSELAHLKKMIRPITDIDLVSRSYHNDPLLILYKAMYDSNDDLIYELNDLPRKTPTGIYKLSIAATYGKIKHSISIDFMELCPTLYDIDLKEINPVFKGLNSFQVNTPTFEEHFAEKLCIVAESNKEDVLNTRIKDFYDIYKLYQGKYDLDKLNYYFSKMIVDRKKINLDNLSVNHLDDDYIISHFNLWLSLSHKCEFLDSKIDFREAVLLTKDLLSKVISKAK